MSLPATAVVASHQHCSAGKHSQVDSMYSADIYVSYKYCELHYLYTAWLRSRVVKMWLASAALCTVCTPDIVSVNCFTI